MNNVKPLTEQNPEDILSMRTDNLGTSYLSEFNNDEYNEPRSIFYIINVCANQANTKQNDIKKKMSEAIQWLCHNGLIAEYLEIGSDRKHFITKKGKRYLDDTRMVLTPLD